MLTPSGEYLLPSPKAAVTALGAELTVRAERRERAAAWVYYDTFDGLARAAGLDVRHQHERLVALDRATGEEVAAAVFAKPPKRAFVTDLPDGPLKQTLAPVISVRALTPIARGRSAEQQLAVLNEDAKTVVRLAVETPTLRGGHALTGRLHVHAVKGYDDEADAVRQALEGQFETAGGSLADEAVIAKGRTPGGTSSKLDVSLDPGEAAETAAAKVSHRLLQTIQDNFPGTLDDVDSEFLHDLRVAVRRTRSLQRQLQALFPPRAIEHARAEFKRLQAVTGDLRDLDVHLLEFEDLAGTLPPALRADLEPLRHVLERRRKHALTATRRALNAKRTGDALAGWGALVDSLAPGPHTITVLAGDRIARVYKRMVKMGDAIGPDSPAEDYHELRKKGKELRYLIEFFGDLFEADIVKPMLKALKALQDVLGRHQDREVQGAELRSLAPEVADDAGGPAALMAMGVLVQRLAQEEVEARAEFAEQFAEFAAPPRRALVQETFAP